MDDRRVRRAGETESPGRATTGDERGRSLPGMLSDPRRFSRVVAAVALILAPIITLAGILATPKAVIADVQAALGGGFPN